MSELEALRAIGRALNTLSVEPLIPLLADGVTFFSQTSWVDPKGKQDVVAYLDQKFSAARASGQRTWAEVGHLKCYPGGPCLVVSTVSPETPQWTFLVKVNEGKITEITAAIIPEPQQSIRTGEFPI